MTVASKFAGATSDVENTCKLAEFWITVFAFCNSIVEFEVDPPMVKLVVLRYETYKVSGSVPKAGSAWWTK